MTNLWALDTFFYSKFKIETVKAPAIAQILDPYEVPFLLHCWFF